MLLFGSIAIVEEASFLGVLREWWTMLRRHLARLLLYETLVILLGFLLAAPFLWPVLFSSLTYPAGGTFLSVVENSTLTIVGGLALTPLLAYLLVANVFIYL